MMDKQHTDNFRKQLLGQREQVLAEVANHQLPTDRTTDVEEKADRAASNSVEIRITENNENLLEKIDFALKRIDAGTYQQCNHCGGEIPMARLRAKPSASLCVSCQEKKDTGRISPP